MRTPNTWRAVAATASRRSSSRFAALGLWAASAIVPGVNVSNTGTLILAAILLGVVNALVRPVLVILTLPLTILTLGLFLLVVNAATIGLVAWLLRGVTVDGLIPGVLAAIVTGVARGR